MGDRAQFGSGRGEIAKANLTTTLTELLREMQNRAEQQRVGGEKRRNLAPQLARLNKAIQGKT